MPDLRTVPNHLYADARIVGKVVELRNCDATNMAYELGRLARRHAAVAAAYQRLGAWMRQEANREH